MSLLLIDNSNTRTKFTLAQHGELQPEPRVLPTAEISPASLAHALEGWVYEQAILCSVVPRAAGILRSSLACPVHEVTAAACPELLSHYPGRATLGADRIANAAAAAAHYPLPCVAVDLGTACTFDTIARVDGAPRLIGGVIAPGLRALAAAPASSTAQLPGISTHHLHTAPALGTDTRTALQAGLYHGYTGMVSGILQSIARQLGRQPFVVLTGGDATLWHPLPTWANVYDKCLTFKGMISIF